MCKRCGKCCHGNIKRYAKENDIMRYEDLGRWDIIDAIKTASSPCPFLRKSINGYHVCIINDIKPEICKNYLCKDVK